jgi:transcriptional regulator
VYIPAAFKEDRIDVLHAAIRAAGPATLVSMTPQGLFASHAPLLLDPHPAPYGTLLGHLAKANPHVRLADAAVQTLVIFHGPNGYITPSYYAAKQ